jgi:RNA methyltransferase, TrmH family
MTNETTSKENTHIKHAKKLLSSSKFRKEEQCFIIEGIRLCEDAFQSGVCIEKVFYTKKCLQKFESIVLKIVKSSKSSFLVGDNIIDIVSDTDTPQGIVCICRQSKKSAEEFDVAGCGNIVLLENIQNPSNLGSILRTCDALNVNTVAVSHGSCDIYNPKTLRGSMGAVFRLNIVFFDNTVEFIKTLQKINYRIYSSVPDSDAKALGDINFESKTCVAFGNEGNGLESETIQACDRKITIPMNKNAESLNVSVAVGIAVWEMTNRGKNVNG